MYINVGVGSLENQVAFRIADIDFNVTNFWNSSNQPISPTNQNGNDGMKLYKGTDAEGNTINDFGLMFWTDNSIKASSSTARQHNDQVVESMDFGLFNDEGSAIIPFGVKYENRPSGGTYGDAGNNIEFTEIEVGETPPANWETQRTSHYYIKKSFGSGTTAQDVYVAIPKSYFDWDTLKAAYDNNTFTHLYYNDKISKRILIGDAEKGISFNVGKGSGAVLGGATGINNPFNCTFARNVNETTLGTNGGFIQAGYDPEDPDYALFTDVNNYPWQTAGWNYPVNLTVASDNYAPFGTSGRLSSSAPDTKDPPIEDVTLCQFGRVKYGTKTYVGIWRINYCSAFYWGFYGNQSNIILTPGSWSQLSTVVASRNEQMNKGMNIRKIAFFGVCLEDIDVVPDVREGEPPIDPPSGDGDYEYPKGRGTFMGTNTYNMLNSPITSGLHIYYLSGTEFSYLVDAFAQWDSWGWQLTNEVQEITNAQPGQTLIQALANWLAASTYGLADSSNFLLSPIGSIVGGVSGAAKNRSTDLQSNIVFCRKMPNFVKDDRVINNADPLMIGPATIATIKPDYFLSERIECSETFDFRLPFVTNTFLDLQPYVKCRVFLPFYGDVDVPVDAFIGGMLTVHYIADILTGKGAVTIRTISYDGYEGWFGPYICDMSVSVPLVQIDANGTSRNAAIVKAAATTAVDAFSGNPAGAVRAGANIYDALDIKSVSQPITTLGSDIGLLTPNAIRIQLTYPKTITQGEESGHNIDNTIAQIGISSYVNGKVSDFLTGKITKYSYVDTSGISATEAEKRAIESLLKGGVY